MTFFELCFKVAKWLEWRQKTKVANSTTKPAVAAAAAAGGNHQLPRQLSIPTGPAAAVSAPSVLSSMLSRSVSSPVSSAVTSLVTAQPAVTATMQTAAAAARGLSPLAVAFRQQQQQLQLQGQHLAGDDLVSAAHFALEWPLFLTSMT